MNKASTLFIPVIHFYRKYKVRGFKTLIYAYNFKKLLYTTVSNV